MAFPAGWPTTAEGALHRAEVRKQELDSLRQVFDSCRWWEWRKRRRIQERAGALIREIRAMVDLSAFLDGDL